MLNRWVGMGRLVRDPVLRHTTAGIAVASLAIACERDYKDERGERGVDYVEVVAWRQRAEFARKYLEKGRMIVVEGRWQMRDYTDRDGNKRRAWEVLADNVYFADSRKADAAQPPEAYAEITEEDEDMPF